MKRLAVVAVSVALLGVAGCGGSDSGGNSDEDQVKETVATFSDNLANEDYGAVCDMYAAESVEFFKAQKQMTGGDCEDLIGNTYGKLTDDQIDGIEADSIDLKGDKANVQLKNGDTLILQKEDGEWMVTLD